MKTTHIVLGAAGVGLAIYLANKYGKPTLPTVQASVTPLTSENDKPGADPVKVNINTSLLPLMPSSEVVKNIIKDTIGLPTQAEIPIPVYNSVQPSEVVLPVKPLPQAAPVNNLLYPELIQPVKPLHEPIMYVNDFDVAIAKNSPEPVVGVVSPVAPAIALGNGTGFDRISVLYDPYLKDVGMVE